MTATKRRFGLSSALTTSFHADGSVDLPRLAAQAQWCLDNGCTSVTLFGTTGEGPSLGLPARQQVIGALKAAGIDFREQVCGGVAAASLHDTLDQMNLLYDADARAILLAPPFYFKGVSEDGLFAWFSALFDKLGERLRDIILYHIPSVTAVPVSSDLIGRLKAAYPKAIIGVKDSSGDWANAETLLAAHQDLSILIGDERFLGKACARGAEGAISGMANIIPQTLLPLVEGRHDERIVAIVDELLRYPVVPAVKSLVADRAGDDGWRNVRLPLLPLPAGDAAKLRQAFEAVFAARAA